LRPARGSCPVEMAKCASKRSALALFSGTSADRLNHRETPTAAANQRGMPRIGAQMVSKTAGSRALQCPVTELGNQRSHLGSPGQRPPVISKNSMHKKHAPRSPRRIQHSPRRRVRLPAGQARRSDSGRGASDNSKIPPRLGISQSNDKNGGPLGRVRARKESKCPRENGTNSQDQGRKPATPAGRGFCTSSPFPPLFFFWPPTTMGLFRRKPIRQVFRIAGKFQLLQNRRVQTLSRSLFPRTTRVRGISRPAKQPFFPQRYRAFFLRRPSPPPRGRGTNGGTRSPRNFGRRHRNILKFVSHHLQPGEDLFARPGFIR